MTAVYAAGGLSRDALVRPACCRQGLPLLRTCWLHCCQRARRRVTESGLAAVELYRASDWEDVVVSSAMIDMFGKCGCFDEARAEFDRMTVRNDVTTGR